jgi:ribonuclease D
MVLPPVQLKPGGPRDDAMIARVEKLKQWRKAAAKELGVESDIALPRSTLLDVARRAPRTGEELAEVMHDSPTRLKQYGEQILKALSG